MQVVEIFSSKQGEGLWTGTPSTFVRTVGCLLHCRFCDTPFAFWNTNEAQTLCLEEILGRILIYGNEHVVLTGGEPMLHAELVPLTQMLRDRNYTITIETSGTLNLPVCCDLMSISPKLSNSTPSLEEQPLEFARHESNRAKLNVVEKLMEIYAYQLKFVVNIPKDLYEIEEYLSHIPSFEKHRILLMPLGTDPQELNEKARWLVPYCREKGYTFCPRMHIEWFGNSRRR